MAAITSDDIKNALVEKFGGVASDWKRGRKGKSPEGGIEREFTDNAQGLIVIVTETDAGLSFKKAEPQLFTGLPALERDPAKITAARTLIKRTLTGGDQESLDDMPELVEKAGDRAYANQFVFAVVSPDPSLQAYDIYINAAVMFRKDKFHNDADFMQVQQLLPNYTEDGSGTNVYSCTRGIEPTHAASGIPPAPAPLGIARLLLQAGFIWDAGYQKACEEYAREPNHVNTAEIRALVTPAATPAGPLPKTP